MALLLPELRGDSIMQQVGCAFILAGKKSGLGTGGFFKNRDIGEISNIWSICMEQRKFQLIDGTIFH